MNSGEGQAKDKLKKYIQDRITELFCDVLDYAELAVDGKERFSNLRSKILRVSNDTIRQIGKEVDYRYSVKALAEDVVVIRRK